MQPVPSAGNQTTGAQGRKLSNWCQALVSYAAVLSVVTQREERCVTTLRTAAWETSQAREGMQTVGTACKYAKAKLRMVDGLEHAT